MKNSIRLALTTCTFFSLLNAGVSAFADSTSSVVAGYIGTKEIAIVLPDGSKMYPESRVEVPFEVDQAGRLQISDEAGLCRDFDRSHCYQKLERILKLEKPTDSYAQDELSVNLVGLDVSWERKSYAGRNRGGLQVEVSRQAKADLGVGNLIDDDSLSLVVGYSSKASGFKEPNPLTQAKRDQGYTTKRGAFVVYSFTTESLLRMLATRK